MKTNSFQGGTYCRQLKSHSLKMSMANDWLGSSGLKEIGKEKEQLLFIH